MRFGSGHFVIKCSFYALLIRSNRRFLGSRFLHFLGNRMRQALEAHGHFYIAVETNAHNVSVLCITLSVQQK